MLAKMAEPFTKALDMLEVEKSAILGKTSSLLLLFTLSLMGSSGSLSMPCVSWSWHYLDHPFRNACMEFHRHLHHYWSIQRKSSEAGSPPSTPSSH